MSDRELLELAAKAAGLEGLVWWDLMSSYQIPGEIPAKVWNPLTDDGDALRLAVKLNLKVDMNFRTRPTEQPGVGVWLPGDCEFYPPFWTAAPRDAARAARDTIVRAAAEIGRAEAASNENSQRGSDK